MKNRRFSALHAVFVIGLFSPGIAITSAEAAPWFQMPFPCGETWEAGTRTKHSPHSYAVDLNRSGDEGDAVVASADGRVSAVKNSGGYGKHLVIDHGGGWTTLYAHLSSSSVSVGDTVFEGKLIGRVGNTGTNTTGSHLHYEQRLNGVLQKIKWNGTGIYYYGKRNYRSANSCQNDGGEIVPLEGRVNTSGGNLTVRSGPGTNYSAVGSLSDGARVTIHCQINGQTVTGTYGTSRLWDKIGSGRYVSDAFVYTGSDGRVEAACN